ncbi:DNA N-6-adenine-methyltransferase [Stenotrophomonas maltophilia]
MANKFGNADGGGFNKETWLTPPHILAALGPFDLDPCAAPSPRPWPSAARHIELPGDGLTAEWQGRVWCNPPYGAQAVRGLQRMAEHGNGVALVFARTETTMFQDQVWPRAHAVLFLRGRIAFCSPDGKPAMSDGHRPSS